MDKRLLAMLVCPICKGKLYFDKETNSLCCTFDRLAFPIKDDIPVMLEHEATLLTLDDVERIKAAS